MTRFRVTLLCLWALAVVAIMPAYAYPSSSPQTSSSSSAAKKKSKKKHSKREPSQQAPTPERISEIQSALARDGYYQGDPNGKWDSNTVASLQKFQSAHGIDSSGKLDAPTLQKLGLGSDIAGVSAPKPLTSPSSSTTPTSPASSQPRSGVPPAGSSSISPSAPASSAVGGSSTGFRASSSSNSQLTPQ